MTNEKRLLPYIKKFYKKIQKNDFVIDKSGVKCVELICPTIILNPLQMILNFNGIRKTPEEYCKKELEWYLSEKLSIINFMDDIKIWNDVCTKDDKKEVNSNYGWCIFNRDNHSQYNFVLNELKNNKFSRRAVMMYNRPAMTADYNRDGMSDYMCSIYTTSLIRDDKLIYTVHQRSCDFIYGFFNDFFWHCYVYNKLLNDLNKNDINVKKGHINYICDSLHVYERHFELIEKIYNSYF
jgi:thymidylate synthase